MVLNYYGQDVDQYSIMDVMRTSYEEGTLSFDIVRGSQFSAMSSSVGIKYPQKQLLSGYPGRPIGLAAFPHDSSSPWMEEIKVLLTAGLTLTFGIGLDRC
jgi:hypothetical protein